MRQLFVICAILVQFLGFISAEARTPAPTVKGTKKESLLTLSSFFQHEHPVDVTSSNHFTNTAFKLRYQRTLPAMANWYNDVISAPVACCKHSDVYTSPLFLPLTRYLLFPNHYFW
ncbi:MAG TPA: hypothetical protein VL095_01820 [Flavisolibacter sp.]|nr:hypothetical protein [Flavisolibacter sp.]